MPWSRLISFLLGSVPKALRATFRSEVWIVPEMSESKRSKASLMLAFCSLLSSYLVFRRYDFLFFLLCILNLSYFYKLGARFQLNLAQNVCSEFED